MTHTDWGVGDGPNHLVYPQWVRAARVDPLVSAGRCHVQHPRHEAAYTSEADVDPWKRHPPRVMPEKGGAIEKLWKLYDTTKVEPDFMKRTATVWEMIKMHVEAGPYVQGTVANVPQVMVKKTDLKNMPSKENLALGGFSEPVDPPDAGGVRPGDVLLGEPGPAHPVARPARHRCGPGPGSSCSGA